MGTLFRARERRRLESARVGIRRIGQPRPEAIAGKAAAEALGAVFDQMRTLEMLGEAEAALQEVRGYGLEDTEEEQIT